MALQEKEPRLPGLLKRLIWAQNQLDDKKVVYPRIAPNDLVTATLSEPVLE
jgi:glucose-induced degradation protein 8